MFDYFPTLVSLSIIGVLVTEKLRPKSWIREKLENRFSNFVMLKNLDTNKSSDYLRTDNSICYYSLDKIPNNIAQYVTRNCFEKIKDCTRFASITNIPIFLYSMEIRVSPFLT